MVVGAEDDGPEGFVSDTCEDMLGVSPCPAFPTAVNCCGRNEGPSTLRFFGGEGGKGCLQWTQQLCWSHRVFLPAEVSFVNVFLRDSDVGAQAASAVPDKDWKIHVWKAFSMNSHTPDQSPVRPSRNITLIHLRQVSECLGGGANTLLITRNGVKTEKVGRNHVSLGQDVPLDSDFELIELLVAPGT